MRRLPAAVAALAVVAACVRQPAPAPAQQHHDGDVVVFLSDDSPACRAAREQLFGATPLGQFLRANFAVVEAPAGSAAARDVRARYRVPDERPRIIVASDRLEHLRLHIVHLDRINEAKLLRQLQAIKASKTIAEFRRATASARVTAPAAR